MDGNEEKSTFTVLVTGANSGLGFATCCRIVDEFLYTRPPSQTLHLLFSTRDTKKSDDTTRRLKGHLQRTLAKTPGQTSSQIKLEGVLVDLTRLLTVKALAKQLLARDQRIDAIICNAGINGFQYIDSWKATKQFFTNFLAALTYPEFMVLQRGGLTKPQLSGHGSVHTFPEPRLGEIFTANVFGHYMLVHWLAPIMSAETRVVWVSSLGGTEDTFDVEDVQGLQAEKSYDSSKRLTDLLVLTSDLPSTRMYVDGFLPVAGTKDMEHEDRQRQESRPRMYLTHPGVVSTTIVAYSSLIIPIVMFCMYLARWLGSPWHPIDPYKGAVSMVYAALGDETSIPELDAREGKGKWGSSTGVMGEERVARTEVEGWEFCGKPGVRPSGSVASSRVGYEGTTKEMREDFEETGRRVWREMEELREEWEGRLGRIQSKGGDAVVV